MLKLREQTHKIKSKLLIVSGVCLFIGIAESLPTKVAIIGLDLSGKPAVLGWFIFIISIYFLLMFLASTTFDIIKYYLPGLINRQTEKTTGDILGLSASECVGSDYVEYEDIGTPKGELKDINLKNEKINKKYNQGFIKLHNCTTYLIDIIFPFMLWVYGAVYLYKYLILL